MKKISTFLILLTVAVLLQSAVKTVKFSSQPPTGYTGAAGSYCVDCHSSFSLNTAGGSVSTTGLPTGTFTAGQAYNFSLTISHSAANRKRWGFSIKAVDDGGNELGTFSSTNTNAAVNSDELSHNSAVNTGSLATYTYANLKWTAPTTQTPNSHVTFYYVGNAANGNGGNDGDYIYSGSKVVALPIALKDFKATIVEGNTVLLKWTTLNEINADHFEIEKSDDDQKYYTVGKVNATGNSTSERSYSFTDDKPSFFNKPVFYRLKLADKDNSFKYSDVVKVQLKSGKTNVVKVYPSLVVENVSVTAEINSDKNQSMTIQFVDASGRVIKQTNANVSNGTNKVRLEVPQVIKAGLLFVRFMSNGFQQTIPITVMK